jgi:hypothetical protein
LVVNLCVLACVASLTAAEATAQQRSATKKQPVAIAYRLSKWKTMHFDDSAKATKHAATVKKLGCETKTDNHGGHIDVTYRRGAWKSLSLSDDKVAHQWEKWLKGAGFETLHGHSHNQSKTGVSQAGHDAHAGHNHGPNGVESIAFRLTNWKTFHYEKKSDVDQLVAIAKGLGCEVREDKHGGHSDVVIRCREWKHAEFPSHTMATKWETQLKKLGFEARHEHGDTHDHAH